MVLDIPPLEEQKKIADMLTAFDAYIKRAVCELDQMCIRDSCKGSQLCNGEDYLFP